MRLSRHATSSGSQWFVDGKALSAEFTLGLFLSLARSEGLALLRAAQVETIPAGPLLSPAESDHEVWASGVTYLRSRNERQAESTVADVYGKVYEAERPEIFFKSVGWRTVGHAGQIRIRKDSTWNVPEPELTLVINRLGEIVGYTAGNDVSSRSIEGENPLYLPQAKTYDGSCALGPEIVLVGAEEMANLEIQCSIKRHGEEVFFGVSRISQMKRQLPELVSFLVREVSFPRGAFLMTGTGIVPTAEFTLLPGDQVAVTIGELTLQNEVAHNA